MPVQLYCSSPYPYRVCQVTGFSDNWGIPTETEFSDEEYKFWLKVRNGYSEMNGKATKEYTKDQMMKWYGKLHTDLAEYKMWGNGIALPNALYVMEGIADALSKEDAWD